MPDSPAPERHWKPCPHCGSAVAELVMHAGLLCVRVGLCTTPEIHTWCDVCGQWWDWVSPDLPPERRAQAEERTKRLAARHERGCGLAPAAA